MSDNDDISTPAQTPTPATRANPPPGRAQAPPVPGPVQANPAQAFLTPAPITTNAAPTPGTTSEPDTTKLLIQAMRILARDAAEDNQDTTAMVGTAAKEMHRIRQIHAALLIPLVHYNPRTNVVKGARFCAVWAIEFDTLFNSPHWTSFTCGNPFIHKLAQDLRNGIEFGHMEESMDAQKVANIVRQLGRATAAAFVNGPEATELAAEAVISTTRVTSTTDMFLHPVMKIVRNFDFMMITIKLAEKMNPTRWHLAPDGLLRRLHTHVLQKFEALFFTDDLQGAIESGIRSKSNYDHLFLNDFESIPSDAARRATTLDATHDRRRERDGSDHYAFNDRPPGQHQQGRGQHNQQHHQRQQPRGHQHGRGQQQGGQRHQQQQQQRHQHRPQHDSRRDDRDDRGYHDSRDSRDSRDDRDGRDWRSNRDHNKPQQPRYDSRDDRDIRNNRENDRGNTKRVFDPDRHCTWCHKDKGPWMSHHTRDCTIYDSHGEKRSKR
jgi:hypothetical protein